MRLILSLCAAAMMIAPALPAGAQDYNTLLDVPDGATLINFSVTERVEVDQDLLIANLRYEAENKSASNVQDEINRVMRKAVDEAKGAKDIKVSTQGYQVYQYERVIDAKANPRTTEKSWRGSQSIMLKSKNKDELLKLVGKLQEMGLSSSNLSYTVSPELYEETYNNMLEAALAKLKTKGERTAKALGKKSSNLLNVNVDSGGYYPQPVMMARAEMAMDAMSMKSAPPVAEAGTSDINLTVTATALIK